MTAIFKDSFIVPVLYNENRPFDSNCTSFPVRSLNPFNCKKQLTYMVFENEQKVLDPTQTARHRNSFIFARSTLSPILQKDDGLTTYNISKVVSKLRKLAGQRFLTYFEYLAFVEKNYLQFRSKTRESSKAKVTYFEKCRSTYSPGSKSFMKPKRMRLRFANKRTSTFKVRKYESNKVKKVEDLLLVKSAKSRSKSHESSGFRFG
ncbi:putative mating-type-like protein a2 [[Candida] jaroonii]|uniref:Mating-type-like protein a2 n=1 Tax=[Candida] jaroonii TaxID=467808 RepID=A0ACA9Y1W9_9ASCO|nr:putative mating-type-like protein a2 [[Candida] jaroonii]